MRRSRKTKPKDTRQFWNHRKISSKPPKDYPANLPSGQGGDVAAATATVGGGGGKRFYGCYLLTSLSPRHIGHTYIGFTVNPKRRIRQHNGEITMGASSTKKKRPWEMVLCIHGFPTNVAALQFEWAWQHPKDSLAVRETAASFKTLGGLANKIKLAIAMLTLPSWNRFDLTVSFFSTTYMKHTAGCPTLPRHMKLHFSSLDELPCYSNPLLPDNDDDDDDDENIQSCLNHDSVDVFDHLNGPPTFGSVETGPSFISYQSYIHDNIDVFDHLNGPPTFGSIETGQSSISYQSYVHDNSDVFDHVNGPPTFGSIETDPSSINYSSYTQHNTPDHICNHQVIDEPSNEEPSYVISDSRPEEQSSIFASHTFSSSVFPILKKHNLNVYADPSQGEPSRQADPSMREQLSKSDYVSITEKPVKNDDFTYVLIDESPEEKQRGKYLSPQRPADIVGPSSTGRIEPVEVIDLYTPSPDCRIVAVSKKSRVSSDYSNFIDLTRSPLFLEL